MSEKPQQEGAMAPEKNRRSSVYIYLAVLFGAAFLMLLLAYFVQLRNNAAVQDDLRSTTASREELLEDIKQLEEETSQLARQVDELNRQLEEERALSAQARQELSDRASSWSDFWALERAYQEGDYERCAELLRDAAGYYATPDSARTRYDEIYQFLDEQGLFGENAPAKR